MPFSNSLFAPVKLRDVPDSLLLLLHPPTFVIGLYLPPDDYEIFQDFKQLLNEPLYETLSGDPNQGVYSLLSQFDLMISYRVTDTLWKDMIKFLRLKVLTSPPYGVEKAVALCDHMFRLNAETHRLVYPHIDNKKFMQTLTIVGVKFRTKNELMYTRAATRIFETVRLWAESCLQMADEGITVYGKKVLSSNIWEAYLRLQFLYGIDFDKNSDDPDLRLTQKIQHGIEANPTKSAQDFSRIRSSYRASNTFSVYSSPGVAVGFELPEAPGDSSDFIENQRLYYIRPNALDVLEQNDDNSSSPSPPIPQQGRPSYVSETGSESESFGVSSIGVQYNMSYEMDEPNVSAEPVAMQTNQSSPEWDSDDNFVPEATVRFIEELKTDNVTVSSIDKYNASNFDLTQEIAEDPSILQFRTDAPAVQESKPVVEEEEFRPSFLVRKSSASVSSRSMDRHGRGSSAANESGASSRLNRKQSGDESSLLKFGMDNVSVIGSIGDEKIIRKGGARSATGSVSSRKPSPRRDAIVSDEPEILQYRMENRWESGSSVSYRSTRKEEIDSQQALLRTIASSGTLVRSQSRESSLAAGHSDSDSPRRIIRSRDTMNDPNILNKFVIDNDIFAGEPLSRKNSSASSTTGSITSHSSRRSRSGKPRMHRPGHKSSHDSEIIPFSDDKFLEPPPSQVRSKAGAMQLNNFFQSAL